jgi:colanic acid/amylovoran biosynthesis glycosyltransferase
MPRRALDHRGAPSRADVRDRIAYFVWCFPWTTFVHREVSALRKAGLDVIVVAQQPPSPESLDPETSALRETTLYPFPAARDALREYHRRFRRAHPIVYANVLLFVMTHRYGRFKSLAEDLELFDKAVFLAGLLQDRHVGHLHSPWADAFAFTALLASRLSRTSFSVQARAYDLHRLSYPYRNGLRAVLRHADFIVTNAEYNRAYIESYAGAGAIPPIHRIYEGVDVGAIAPRAGRRSTREKPHLLCVGQMIEPKGLVYLLEACALLRQRGHRFTCAIVGPEDEQLSTNYVIRLKKLHRRLRLEGLVTFEGEQPFARVLESYRQADVFVLPCVPAHDGHRDITPNALMEAMAVGLPVVSTAITAIPELVEDGVSGLLVPPADPAALADAIETVLGDAELGRMLGEAARRRVEERFDIERNIAEYVKAFGDVLREPVSEPSEPRSQRSQSPTEPLSQLEHAPVERAPGFFPRP